MGIYKKIPSILYEIVKMRMVSTKNNKNTMIRKIFVKIRYFKT